MDNNEQNVLNETDWSKLTFLTKKEDEDKTKDKSKGVRIGYISFLSFSILSVLALIVLTIVFGTNGNPNFTAQRGYGVFGLIIFLLFLLSLGAYSVLRYLYNTKWYKSEKRDAYLALSNSSYYLAVGFLYSTFALIPLRQAVLDISEVFSYWNIILLVVVWLICIALMGLEFKKGAKTNKVAFGIASIVLPSLILCFSSILIQNYSLSGFSLPLLVSAVLSGAIALPLLLDQKKDSSVLVGNFFSVSCFILDAVAILYYGMIVASNLY